MSKEQTEITTQAKPTGLQASLDVRGMELRSFRVLKEKLYPNVSDESLLMAIDYCKARKLDIFKRSIQIVPIWDPKTKAFKDTFWPSITEVRITATRTGQYAGASEAEFGNPITKEFVGKIQDYDTKQWLEVKKVVTYPEWCKITVSRMVGGQKCEFIAKLFWLESYKASSGKSEVPNDMWGKRPYAQLEKCTEAAALRKAFPEEVGNDYIAEEAFDSNEGLLNVTPKSKTAAAHLPPRIIEESFQSDLKQIDIEEEVAEVSNSESASVNTPFFDQEKERKTKEVFDELSKNIKMITTERGLNAYLKGAANKTDYLDENNSEMKEEFIALVSKRYEEVRDGK